MKPGSITSQSKRQSNDRKGVGEPRPKRPNMQQPTSEVMASEFWDAQRILFSDYVDKGKTIDSAHVCGLL